MAAADTRRSLLSAGRAEFAARGLAGARVDRIASAAGASKERIYGYFGNKEGLFAAVLDDALEELAASVAIYGPDDVARYIARVAEFHAQNPHLLRLLLWDQLERPTASISQAREAFYAEKRVRAAYALGLRDGAQAGALMYQLIGVAVWPLVLPQLAELLAGGSSPVESSKLRDSLAQHLESTAVASAKE